MQHYRARRYREAIREFEQSASTVPNAELWFDIGRAHEQLGEYGLAIENYRGYLRDRVDAPDADELTHHIETLAQRAQQTGARRGRSPIIAARRRSRSTHRSRVRWSCSTASKLGDRADRSRARRRSGIAPIDASRARTCRFAPRSTCRRARSARRTSTCSRSPACTTTRAACRPARGSPPAASAAARDDRGRGALRIARALDHRDQRRCDRHRRETLRCSPTSRWPRRSCSRRTAVLLYDARQRRQHPTASPPERASRSLDPFEAAVISHAGPKGLSDCLRRVSSIGDAHMRLKIIAGNLAVVVLLGLAAFVFVSGQLRTTCWLGSTAKISSDRELVRSLVSPFRARVPPERHAARRRAPAARRVRRARCR